MHTAYAFGYQQALQKHAVHNPANIGQYARAAIGNFSTRRAGSPDTSRARAALQRLQLLGRRLSPENQAARSLQQSLTSRV